MLEFLEFVLCVFVTIIMRKNQRVSFSAVANDFKNIFESATAKMKEYICEGKSNKFSTDRSGNKHFKKFSKNIIQDLKVLDIENRMLNSINEHLSELQKQKVLYKLDIIKDEMTKQIFSEFEKCMHEYAINEREHISKCLKGESVFNLTNKSIPPEIVDWIKNGPKYNPYVTKSMRRYMRDFDIHFASSLKRIIRYYKGSRSVINLALHPHNIEEQLGKIISSSRNYRLNVVLRKLLNAYKVQRKIYRYNIKRVINENSEIKSDELEKMFSFNDERIIVCADKGLGFTIMNIEDYKSQYTKINNQQHFGKVDLDEDIYISQILEYLSDMKKSIPKQLSNIIKPSDFDFKGKAPSLGILRLLPKILKLKTIGPESVDVLKSQGIKASLNDPIQCVQKSLDNIFNHLLFYIEQHFHRRFNRLSPSTTGVIEALERIKEADIGGWGDSVAMDSDFTGKN